MHAWWLCLRILAGAPHSDVLLLENVQRVDVAARTISSANVAIVDGRIAPWDEASLMPHATVLDMNHAWLIPGLIDLHVHVLGNPLPDGRSIPMDAHATGRAMLAAGVTAMLDLAGDPEVLFDVRAEQRRGTARSDGEADLYAAGHALRQMEPGRPQHRGRYRASLRARLST